MAEDRASNSGTIKQTLNTLRDISKYRGTLNSKIDVNVQKVDRAAGNSTVLPSDLIYKVPLDTRYKFVIQNLSDSSLYIYI